MITLIIILLIWTVVVFGSCTVYLIIPLSPQILDVILPLNASRERTLMYQTEYFIDPDTNFYVILFHTYIGTIMTIVTIVALDTMFAAYVQHYCGILEIVG